MSDLSAQVVGRGASHPVTAKALIPLPTLRPARPGPKCERNITAQRSAQLEPTVTERIAPTRKMWLHPSQRTIYVV